MSKVDEKWNSVGDNPLVIISEIRRIVEDWVKEVGELTGDEELVKGLNVVARIIGGDMPEPAKVAYICTKLEGLSVYYRTQFGLLVGFKKGTKQSNELKNLYKEVYTGIDRLVDSLKYIVR